MSVPRLHNCYRPNSRTHRSTDDTLSPNRSRSRSPHRRTHRRSPDQASSRTYSNSSKKCFNNCQNHPNNFMLIRYGNLSDNGSSDSTKGQIINTTERKLEEFLEERGKLINSVRGVNFICVVPLTPLLTMPRSKMSVRVEAEKDKGISELKFKLEV